MISISTRLRRVGNSLGVIVPSQIINQKNLREGQGIVITIQRKNKTTIGDILREARKQRLNFTRSTQEILDEINEDE
jgi:antitoxin component of MazEF toxin-antitoxin module